MELEGQIGQEGQTGQPDQEVQQPTIDPRVAMEIAAQQFGVTPDYLEGSIRLQDENRRQIDSLKRRERELEIKEAKLDALASERQRYEPTQSYQDMDPVGQRIMERLDKIDRRYDDERRERIDTENRMAEVQRIGDQLNEQFQALQRTLPTQQQMDPQRFFGSMRELWPNGPPDGITPDRAVNITAKYLGISTNGAGPSAYTPQANGNPYRNPRASIVIPGGTTGQGPTMAAGMDTAPQRSGETVEQYAERMKRAVEGLRFQNIPENVRFSSG